MFSHEELDARAVRAAVGEAEITEPDPVDRLGLGHTLYEGDRVLLVKIALRGLWVARGADHKRRAGVTAARDPRRAEGINVRGKHQGRERARDSKHATDEGRSFSVFENPLPPRDEGDRNA